MYDFKYFQNEGIWEHEPDDGMTITLTGDSNGYDPEHLQIVEDALTALGRIVSEINSWMLTWFLDPQKEHFKAGMQPVQVKYLDDDTVIISANYGDPCTSWDFYVRFYPALQSWKCSKFICETS
ncbi:MAG: hypothetical protein ACI8W8_000801 [Rhodothermales bacterium]|jgi:hypothetical protein